MLEKNVRQFYSNDLVSKDEFLPIATKLIILSMWLVSKKIPVVACQIILINNIKRFNADPHLYSEEGKKATSA